LKARGAARADRGERVRPRAADRGWSPFVGCWRFGDEATIAAKMAPGCPSR